MKTNIQSVRAREILDSRGNLTVEVDVTLARSLSDLSWICMADQWSLIANQGTVATLHFTAK